jgi:hypothetical protein
VETLFKEEEVKGEVESQEMIAFSEAISVNFNVCYKVAEFLGSHLKSLNPNSRTIFLSLTKDLGAFDGQI